jgi:hypothetical protein
MHAGQYTQTDRPIGTAPGGPQQANFWNATTAWSVAAPKVLSGVPSRYPSADSLCCTASTCGPVAPTPSAPPIPNGVGAAVGPRGVDGSADGVEGDPDDSGDGCVADDGGSGDDGPAAVPPP